MLISFSRCFRGREESCKYWYVDLSPRHMDQSNWASSSFIFSVGFYTKLENFKHTHTHSCTPTYTGFCLRIVSGCDFSWMVFGFRSCSLFLHQALIAPVFRILETLYSISATEVWLSVNLMICTCTKMTSSLQLGHQKSTKILWISIAFHSMEWRQ